MPQYRGVGGWTPYHLIFGQRPQVGISNWHIAPNLLSNLATEMDVKLFGSPTGYFMQKVLLLFPQNIQLFSDKLTLKIKNSQRYHIQRNQWKLMRLPNNLYQPFIPKGSLVIQQRLLLKSWLNVQWWRLDQEVTLDGRELSSSVDVCIMLCHRMSHSL